MNFYIKKKNLQKISCTRAHEDSIKKHLLIEKIYQYFFVCIIRTFLSILFLLPYGYVAKQQSVSFNVRYMRWRSDTMWNCYEWASTWACAWGVRKLIKYSSWWTGTYFLALLLVCLLFTSHTCSLLHADLLRFFYTFFLFFCS